MLERNETLTKSATVFVPLTNRLVDNITIKKGSHEIAFMIPNVNNVLGKLGSVFKNDNVARLGFRSYSMEGIRYF